MTTAAQPVDDPKIPLSDARELGRKVRKAQRGTWLALLVLGVTVLGAIPFYEYGHSVVARCETRADGSVFACSRYPTLALWYWPVALVVAYAVIGAIFARRARSRGVGARVRPYVVGGIVLVAIATLVTAWGLHHPLSWAQLGSTLAPTGSVAQAWLHRLVGPLGVIGVGLLVLARVERSPGVAAFGIAYLVAVIASAPLGVHGGRVFLPGLLVPGLVLLAGSALFAVLERPTKPGAS